MKDNDKNELGLALAYAVSWASSDKRWRPVAQLLAGALLSGLDTPAGLNDAEQASELIRVIQEQAWEGVKSIEFVGDTVWFAIAAADEAALPF